jgi:hypothetical protein
VLNGALLVGCTNPTDGSDANMAAPSAPVKMAAPSAADAGSAPSKPAPASSAIVAGGRPSLGNTPLPCDVQQVLATSCQGCHAAEPGAQAPMALVSFEDLTAPAVSDPSTKVYALVERRIHAGQHAMPPSSSRRLTGAELATLDDFVSAGAPAGSTDCTAAPDGGADAVQYVQPAASEIDQCYRVAAHDLPMAGDTTPHHVASGESYSCFYFSVPWREGSQALSIRASDDPLAHHLLLYEVTEAYTDGQITRGASNCGLDGGRQVLAVHTHSEPSEQDMPVGVGLQLPPPGSGHGLLLEVHYFNTGDSADDSTGFDVCTAKTPRPHTAGIGMLGASDFVLPPAQATDVQNTCTLQFKGDVHVFRSLPHMHARGVAMDTVIQRAAGGTDVMMNTPFDFNHQVMLETPAVVHPSDSLVTTCHYVNDTDNFISSGFSTGEEMCVHFVYAWPAGVLYSTLTDGGQLACAEP